jgi:hypothetical protein
MTPVETKSESKRREAATAALFKKANNPGLLVCGCSTFLL